MTRTLCLLITWGALAQLCLFPTLMVYFLVDQQAFMELARSTLALAIHWNTVTSTQLYALWAITAVYLSIGTIGTYFLFRAFKNFSNGEYFTAPNSTSLKRFAILLLAQACLQPIHGAAASVLLSLNHPAGEKLLSVSLGTNELRNIAVAVILWVIGELLVKARALADENQAFV